ncbi:hypothetical protein HK100_000206 [Physocladia obscura]|uniref:SANT domain-containing protein n=1 Tax=Physocladia obscura TaxID=109957 RepID=A0AAD5T0I5_9FUNG|nr:hypothetical protein HK100_000206 [Physocladia obscura]
MSGKNTSFPPPPPPPTLPGHGQRSGSAVGNAQQSSSPAPPSPAPKSRAQLWPPPSSSSSSLRRNNDYYSSPDVMRSSSGSGSGGGGYYRPLALSESSSLGKQKDSSTILPPPPTTFKSTNTASSSIASISTGAGLKSQWDRDRDSLSHRDYYLPRAPSNTASRYSQSSMPHPRDEIFATGPSGDRYSRIAGRESNNSPSSSNTQYMRNNIFDSSEKNQYIRRNVSPDASRFSNPNSSVFDVSRQAPARSLILPSSQLQKPSLLGNQHNSGSSSGSNRMSLYNGSNSYINNPIKRRSAFESNSSGSLGVSGSEIFAKRPRLMISNNNPSYQQSYTPQYGGQKSDYVANGSSGNVGGGYTSSGYKQHQHQNQYQQQQSQVSQRSSLLSGTGSDRYSSSLIAGSNGRARDYGNGYASYSTIVSLHRQSSLSGSPYTGYNPKHASLGGSFDANSRQGVGSSDSNKSGENVSSTYEQAESEDRKIYEPSVTVRNIELEDPNGSYEDDAREVEGEDEGIIGTPEDVDFEETGLLREDDGELEGDAEEDDALMNQMEDEAAAEEEAAAAAKQEAAKEVSKTHIVRKPFGTSAILDISAVCDKLLEENRIRAKENSKKDFLILSGFLSPANSVQIRRKVEEYPFYNEIIERHETFRSILVEYVADRKFDLANKREDLREEYAEQFAIHKKKLAKLEKKRRSSQGPPLAYANPAFNSNNQHVSSSVESFGTRSSRRNANTAAFTSDAVKSEAEWEQVLAAIAATEQSEIDDSKMISHTVADPPMIIDPLERRIFNFQSFNRLVTDPAAELELSNSTLEMKWSEKDRELFRYKLVQYGKDFPKIAAALGNKTTQDCIQYYYREKFAGNFKLLLRKAANNRSNMRRRMNALAKKQTSSKSLIRQEEQLQPVPPETVENRVESGNSLSVANCEVIEQTPAKRSNDVNSTKSKSKSRQAQLEFEETSKFSVSGVADSTRWTVDEKSRALQAFEQYGRDYLAVSIAVGSKTMVNCEDFYNSYKRKLNLDVITAKAESRINGIDAAGVDASLKKKSSKKKEKTAKVVVEVEVRTQAVDEEISSGQAKIEPVEPKTSRDDARNSISSHRSRYAEDDQIRPEVSNHRKQSVGSESVGNLSNSQTVSHQPIGSSQIPANYPQTVYMQPATFNSMHGIQESMPVQYLEHYPGASYLVTPYLDIRGPSFSTYSSYHVLPPPVPVIGYQYPHHQEFSHQVYHHNGTPPPFIVHVPSQQQQPQQQQLYHMESRGHQIGIADGGAIERTVMPSIRNLIMD